MSLTDFLFKSIMSRKTQRLIQLASEIALTTEGKMKHCALLVLGKKVVKAYKNNECCHAEHGIIKYLDSLLLRMKKSEHRRKLRKYDLYVCRVNSEGILRNSKPCNHCIDEIRSTNMIRRVIYSDFDFEDSVPFSISEKASVIENAHITFGNRCY